jgi:hypothetical protein
MYKQLKNIVEEREKSLQEKLSIILPEWKLFIHEEGDLETGSYRFNIYLNHTESHHGFYYFENKEEFDLKEMVEMFNLFFIKDDILKQHYTLLAIKQWDSIMEAEKQKFIIKFLKENNIT